MDPIGIIVAIACVLIVGSVFGSYIYKKVKHLPTGECACCQKDSKKKQSKLLKEYYRRYPKNNDK